jgi:endonuclease-3 related protein
MQDAQCRINAKKFCLYHISEIKNMQDRNIRKKLMALYRALYRSYGPQHWWPGDTPFEVMAGAVLTQNTAWSNVEKAIANLKWQRLLTPSRLNSVPSKRLASLIRPCGYFNIKTRRLKNLLVLIRSHYQGSLKRMFADDPAVLRASLLGVNGIGPETADSILLYAAGKPFFVVDTYTKRILDRHGLISNNADYHKVQRLFMENLPKDARLYNEFHALIVKVGKERCRKRKPLCSGCPLGPLLP